MNLSHWFVSWMIALIAIMSTSHDHNFVVLAAPPPRRSKRNGSQLNGTQIQETASTDVVSSVNRIVNLSYLHCAFHSQALLRVPEPDIPTTSTAKVDPKKMPYFMGSDGLPTTTWSSATATSSNESITRSTCRPVEGANPCGLQWIEESEYFSGMDSLILVGDSTMLRMYMHIIRASDEVYRTKVQGLEEAMLNSTIALSSGRQIPVYFIRALHVSTSIDACGKAFDIAQRNSFIVFSFGPHDTSWLVFRKPMPGFRRVNTGNWNQARIYWNRYTAMLINYIAHRLTLYEERGGEPLTGNPEPSSGKKKSSSAHSPFSRPVVAFREQYIANCGHPKYSKYPLITRCPDLLMPIVIPYYRWFLSSMAGSINIPVIGIDDLLRGKNGGRPLCHLIDAGHMNRKCNRYELQLLMQTFRMTRRLGIVQGFSPSVHTKPYNLFNVIREAGLGSKWETMGDLVSQVPPAGYPPSMFSSVVATKAVYGGANVTAMLPPLQEVHPMFQNARCDQGNSVALASAKHLFQNFDDAMTIEHDVLAFDESVDLHQLRATRCSRSLLHRTEFDDALSSCQNVSLEAAVPEQVGTSPIEQERSSQQEGQTGRQHWLALDGSVLTGIGVTTAVILYVTRQIFWDAKR